MKKVYVVHTLMGKSRFIDVHTENNTIINKKIIQDQTLFHVFTPAYTMEYCSDIQKMKSCHMLQHGWTYSRSPQPLALRTGTTLWPVRNWVTQQEVSGQGASKASLELLPELCFLFPHPHPTLPPSMEKLSSSNPVSGAKKVGDC